MNDKQGVLVTRKSARQFAEGNRQRKGRLSPLSQHKRRVFGDFDVTPMVVTEVSNSPLIGLKQNVSIDSWFTSLSAAGGAQDDGTFEAKPFQLGISTLKDLDDVDPVRIASRLVPSVMFTGQLFLFAACGEYYDNGKAVAEGDVITANNGNRWRGIVTTETRSLSPLSSMYVDVIVQPRLTNPTATGVMANGVSRQYGCRVLASNETGIQLVNGQNVILDYTPNLGFDGDVGSVGSRWRISEYKCSPATSSTGGGTPPG